MPQLIKGNSGGGLFSKAMVNLLEFHQLCKVIGGPEQCFNIDGSAEMSKIL